MVRSVLSHRIRDNPGQWHAYALAFGFTALALILELALVSWTNHRPLLALFVIPVILAAYVGGRWVAFFATLCAAAAGLYVVLFATAGSVFDRPIDLLRWLILVIVGLAVSGMSRPNWLRPRKPFGSGTARRTTKDLELTEWKVRAGFAGALACLGVVGTAAYVSVESLNNAVASVAHSQEVLASLRGVATSISGAELDERAFSIAHYAPYADLARQAADSIEAQFARLRRLAQDSPLETSRLNIAAAPIAERIQAIRSIEAVDARSALAANRLHDEIQQQLNAIIDVETRSLADRRQAARRNSETAVAVIGGGGILAGVVVGLVLFGLRRDVAHHARADRILRAVNEELEERVTERTEDLRSQLQRLNLLQSITREVGNCQNLSEMYAVTVSIIEKQLPVELCTICTCDPDGGYVRLVAGSAQDAGVATEIARGIRLGAPLRFDWLARCLQGESVHEPETADLPLRLPPERGPWPRSLAAVPLHVDRKLFGVLICSRERQQGFRDDDLEFLRQLSEHVSLAADKVQLHDALRSAYNELRQSQSVALQQERLRALGQMASGIAHDINNAISPVTLYTESLIESEPDLTPDGRMHIGIIRRAVGDVAQTVARLQDFSRQRESSITLTPLDLNVLVHQVISVTHARWSDMAQRRGIVIDVQTELAEDLPMILGVEGELRNAIVNLIFNAVDAMPEGGALRLRTSTRERPGIAESPRSSCVRLEVTDSGAGMDEETRRRCMEPFFTTKGERGTGLGLAMVYGTMKRHGAEIEVQSAIGQGTTFRFDFSCCHVQHA